MMGRRRNVAAPLLAAAALGISSGSGSGSGDAVRRVRDDAGIPAMAHGSAFVTRRAGFGGDIVTGLAALSVFVLMMRGQ